MIYKCVDCGHLFEDGEQATWVEMHGFTYGNGETFYGCPICRGDYDETVECKSCGSHHFEEDLENGICKECIAEYEKDVLFCLNLGEKETVKVEINGAVASLWSEDEINEILTDYVKYLNDVSFEKFANQDMFYFSQMIEDEVDKK